MNKFLLPIFLSSAMACHSEYDVSNYDPGTDSIEESNNLPSGQGLDFDFPPVDLFTFCFEIDESYCPIDNTTGNPYQPCVDQLSQNQDTYQNVMTDEILQPQSWEDLLSGNITLTASIHTFTLDESDSYGVTEGVDISVALSDKRIEYLDMITPGYEPSVTHDHDNNGETHTHWYWEEQLNYPSIDCYLRRYSKTAPAYQIIASLFSEYNGIDDQLLDTFWLDSSIRHDDDTSNQVRVGDELYHEDLDPVFVGPAHRQGYSLADDTINSAKIIMGTPWAASLPYERRVLFYDQGEWSVYRP